MNITLVPSECNIENTIFCPLTPEEFMMLSNEGLIDKKKRTYRMVLHHREIHVECPILMDGKRAVGVILPAFKLPYRPYPCYVYLYAIALYMVGYSMRKAADKVRKKFGISRFSHSTISRTLSILLIKADLLSAVVEPDTGKSDIIGFDLNESRKPLPSIPVFTERKSWTQEKRQAAFCLFKSLGSLLVNPEAGMLLVYRYFMRYCCLLI
jgi:hypothetical protein